MNTILQSDKHDYNYSQCSFQINAHQEKIKVCTSVFSLTHTTSINEKYQRLDENLLFYNLKNHFFKKNKCRKLVWIDSIKKCQLHIQAEIVQIVNSWKKELLFVLQTSVHAVGTQRITPFVVFFPTSKEKCISALRNGNIKYM